MHVYLYFPIQNPSFLFCEQTLAPAIDWLSCLQTTFHPHPVSQSDHVLLHNLPYIVHMSRIIGKWLNKHELSGRYFISIKNVMQKTVTNITRFLMKVSHEGFSSHKLPLLLTAWCIVISTHLSGACPPLCLVALFTPSWSSVSSTLSYPRWTPGSLRQRGISP